MMSWALKPIPLDDLIVITKTQISLFSSKKEKLCTPGQKDDLNWSFLFIKKHVDDCYASAFQMAKINKQIDDRDKYLPLYLH